MADKLDSSATMLLDALRSVLDQVAQPSQVLKTILGQAVAQTGADRGVFVQVNRDGRLSYRVLYKFQKEELTGVAGHYSRSLFAEVLRTGQGLRSDNAMDDPRFTSKDSVHDLKLTSVLCLPIHVGDEVAALVHLESDRPDHFREQHEQLLAQLLSLAGHALATLRASEGVIRELEQNRELLAQEYSFGRFVGRSTVVRELGEKLSKAAGTDFPVLLIGETGTGKTILARVLHHSSARAKKAFVTVFCPSLQKEMVETTLFGHKRGAFTGAVDSAAGKVQAAERGTLFLDEIGELPLDIQPKLLRLLQEKTYERVGEATERHADVRVIAATNRDLDVEVSKGRFRRDLYERLNYLPVRVPPLRERREDIPLLLRHCLDQSEEGRWVELTPEAERYLVELDFLWPGNVRHLEHLAVRLGLEGKRGGIGPAELRRLLDTTAGEAPAGAGSLPEGDVGLPTVLARTEKAWIEEAIRRYPDLPRGELAKKLQIGTSTLFKKLKEYSIEA